MLTMSQLTSGRCGRGRGRGVERIVRVINVGAADGQAAPR